MPSIQAVAPKGLKIDLLFDQSLFVRAAISGVVQKSVVAALLTATMILVFLGSWRSTLIVAVSIPLSILFSLTMLHLLGQTLNVMTLGGLSLAVGILVDDATVEIENIHRNAAMGKPLRRAILDGAQQIAAPTFVSTLTICAVFVSVIFLEGPPRYLFVPLALAVVFAMLASYLLSRTLVPVMADYLLPAETDDQHGRDASATLTNTGETPVPPDAGTPGRPARARRQCHPSAGPSALSSRLRAGLRAHPRWVPAAVGVELASPPHRVRRFSGGGRQRFPYTALHRPRFLSAGRRRAVPPARPRPPARAWRKRSNTSPSSRTRSAA